MPVRLRLQRHGRKGKPFYHIVAADSRAPRDGRYIEKVGTYNPNTDPATIDLNNERALQWLEDGAQPSDTVNAILKYTGVRHLRHLQRGVAKGAFTQEEADAKFLTWDIERVQAIQAKIDSIKGADDTKKANRLKVEAEISQKRAEEIAKRLSPIVVAEETTEEVAEAVAEETTEEVVEAVAEETTEEVVEAVAEETTEEVVEAVAEETTEEVVEAVAETTEEVVETVEETVEEVKEDAPAVEASADENSSEGEAEEAPKK